jgi:hypothetical protein
VNRARPRIDTPAGEVFADAVASSRILLRLLGLACAALLALGATCGKPSPRPGRFSLKFTMDPALAGASIQVDIVGPNAISDLPRLETYSVSEYWKPGDPMRRDLPKTVLYFGPGHEAMQTLPASDPVWTNWLRAGASTVVIFADLPGTQADRPGASDPRRLIVPIDEHEWHGVKTLEFMIQESGVRLVTARPAK